MIFEDNYILIHPQHDSPFIKLEFPFQRVFAQKEDHYLNSDN